MVRLIMITFSLLAATAGAQPLMTLEEAVALGLKSNYDIRIARNDAEIADNRTGLGTAGFLPKLDASGGYARIESDQDVNLPESSSKIDSDSWNAEVSLNWTLFDGFTMFTNRARYNELARLGEYRARNQIESVVVSISRAYLNLVQQERLLEVARQTRDISETRLNRERVRNELGGASSTDLLNAQVAFNADESALLDQELQVIIARKELNVLLGRDPSTEFMVIREIDVPDLERSFEEAAATAEERNAALTAAELGLQVARRDVQNAWSPFMPRLTAFASYGYTDLTRTSSAGDFAGLGIGTATTSGTVGINVSLNIFNGGRDRIALQNARIEATNQELAFRDARNRLLGEVRETYDTYRQQLEVVSLRRQNIEAARQNLNLLQEQYELGGATSLEFRDAQVSLAEAEAALIAALFQARLSRIEIDRLTGDLLAER